MIYDSHGFPLHRTIGFISEFVREPDAKCDLISEKYQPESACDDESDAALAEVKRCIA